MNDGMFLVRVLCLVALPIAWIIAWKDHRRLGQPAVMVMSMWFGFMVTAILLGYMVGYFLGLVLP